MARGAELQYLRQLWHGGEAQPGSDSIWFDLNRMEAELTERAMQKCSQRHICCNSLLTLLPTTSLAGTQSKNKPQIDFWKGVMDFYHPNAVKVNNAARSDYQLAGP